MSALATRAIELSPKEAEALLGRLELSDCVAGALTDAPEGEEPAVSETAEQVEERASLLARFASGPARTLPEGLTELDCAILVEAVEGSTFLANLEDDPDKGRSRKRTMKGLIGKLIAAGIAREITSPSN